MHFGFTSRFFINTFLPFNILKTCIRQKFLNEDSWIIIKVNPQIGASGYESRPLLFTLNKTEIKHSFTIQEVETIPKE